MSKKESIVAKLKLLGYPVETVDRYCSLSTEPNGCKRIISDEGISEDLFNYVLHLDGTNYSIVREFREHKYGLVFGNQSIKEVMRYKDLESPLLIKDNDYNIIAREETGLYGVINLNEDTVIRARHDSLVAYGMEKTRIYVGNIGDKTIIYDILGKVLDISRKLKYTWLLVGADLIIDYKISHSSVYTMDIYNISGELINEFKECRLITQENGYYSILDIHNKVLIKDIKPAIEF